MQNAAAAQDLNEFISFFLCQRFFFVCSKQRARSWSRAPISSTLSNARISYIACVKNLVINACRFLMKNSTLE